MDCRRSVAALVCALAVPASSSPPAAVPGELIVRFHEGDAPGGFGSRAVAMRHAPGSRLRLLSFPEGTDIEAEAQALRNDPAVRFAEPNYLGSLADALPSDPLYPEQAGDLATVGVAAAWSIQPSAPSTIRVAIVDSGVDATHLDLAASLDVASSYNFQNHTNRIFDDLGHGTRVAGIVAASANNGRGIAGVANGATILSLDVADSSNRITALDVADAVDYAVGHGAQVVNLSLRFSADSQAVREACEAASAAGVLLVAAAGNENQGDVPVYPAAYPSVLGVGALEDDGATRASFSNYSGRVALADLFAPGSTVFTTVPGSQYSGTYSSGTSFAAPVVSGVAALLAARNPGQSGAALAGHLLETATPLGAPFEPEGAGGAGRLDAALALTTPMVPMLSIASVAVDDARSLGVLNDADGALDSGETARLYLTLKVSGADAGETTATLSTAFGAVEFPDGGDVVHLQPARVGAVDTSPAFGPFTVTEQLGASTATFTVGLDGAVNQALTFQLPIESEVNVSGVLVNKHFTADRTYRATSNLSLRGETVIDPGASIKVDPGVELRVERGGSLVAVGTAEEPIQLARTKAYGSALNDDGRPRAGASGKIGPQTEPVDLGLYQQVRYVDGAGGSDAMGDGSQGAPWASVTFALSSVTNAANLNKYAILVAEGTYAGATVQMKTWVDMYGGFEAKGWTRDIKAHETVLDGQQLRVVARGANQSRFDGFHVTRGGSFTGMFCNVTSPVIANNHIDRCYVGVSLSSSSANILNNLIDNNNGNGGVYCASGSPVLRGNALLGNSSGFTSSRVYIGGSGVIGSSTNATVENNIISENLAGGFESRFSRADGELPPSFGSLARILRSDAMAELLGGPLPAAGPRILEFASVQNNTITGNRADRGGGIYSWPGLLGAGANVIARNQATYAGGGVYCGSLAGLANNVIVDNTAPNGAGIAIETTTGAGAAVVTNNTLTGNIASSSGGGVYSLGAGMAPVVTNCILWGNSPDPSAGTPAPVLANCQLEDPKFTGPLALGLVSSLRAGETSYQTIATLADSALAPDVLAGRVVKIGGYSYSVASNTSNTIVVNGDARRGGAVSAPVNWHLFDYHIVASSPCRGAGVGPGEDPSVPTVDFEADPRAGATCDIGADEYNLESSPGGGWGRLRIASDASGAVMEHVIVDGCGGVIVECADTGIASCQFSRNSEFGLRATVPLSLPVVDSTASLNLGPGMDCPGTPLEECEADGNATTGLAGGALSHCRSDNNGADGMAADSATDCSVSTNAGAGATLSGDATRVVASFNRGDGIALSAGDADGCDSTFNEGWGIALTGGGTVSACVAASNTLGGVYADGGVVTDCRAAHNGDSGIVGGFGAPAVAGCEITGNAGYGVLDAGSLDASTVHGNGEGGVTGVLTVGGSYIASNEGYGVSSGAISDCTVIGNAGDGVGDPVSVNRCSIVGNGGWGVASFSLGGALANCTLQDNEGGGASNVFAANACNFLSNGALEARTTELGGGEDLDFTGNFWGSHNPEIDCDGNPFANQSFIRDFQDGSGDFLINYCPNAATFVPNLPESESPGFLTSVSPDESIPLGVGEAIFTLTYLGQMDSAVDPAVTFDLSAPYARYVVEPFPGWVSATVWQGHFWVQDDTAQGTHTLKVSRARTAGGFVIPDDTGHRIIIDAGSGAANNGAAKGTGTRSIRTSWPSGASRSTRVALGYNVLRSETGEAGTFELLTQVPLPIDTNYYVDTGLEPLSNYYYVVFLVQAGSDAVQWTKVFEGETLSTDPNPLVPGWIVR